MSNAPTPIRPWAIMIKGLLLFLAVNFLFVLPWSGHLGKYSLYNSFLPKLDRLPVSTTDFEAVVSSHRITNPKMVDEYRVILLGDSSIYAGMVKYDKSVAFRVSAKNLQTCDGKLVKAYNLGLPNMSVLKDLLILDAALKYEPDMVIWFVSMATFQENQLKSPLVRDNPDKLFYILDKHEISLKLSSDDLAPPTLWERTLIGQREYLASLVDFQMSAFAWAGTHDDTRRGQYIPISERQLTGQQVWNGLSPNDDLKANLRLDIFYKVLQAVGDIPILVINEPMYITSRGANSEFQYNPAYPKWAYDTYREVMLQESRQNGWKYLDLWKSVPAKLFSDSAFHRNSVGESIVAKRVALAIQEIVCP